MNVSFWPHGGGGGGGGQNRPHRGGGQISLLMHVALLIYALICIPDLSMQAGKALERPHTCTDAPETSLLPM